MGVDTLHFVRSGASLETFAALDPRYFGIAQIGDALGTHSRKTTSPMCTIAKCPERATFLCAKS